MLAAFALVAGSLSLGQAQAPIKIGFMVPLSGGSAQNGRDILNGFLLYLDEIGYRAGGRQIQLIVEDDEAIPAVGLTKARKLVERDEVHVMGGALLSSTGYALAPYIDSMQIPMVYPVVSADDLTQRRRSKWIVRTGWSGSQPNHAFGEYAYHTLGFARSSRSRSITRSVGSRSAALSGRSSPRADASDDESGSPCRCTTSRPTSRKCPETSMRSTRSCWADPRCSS